VIKGDGTAAKKDECESESGQSQRKFISAVSHQSVVQMHLRNRNRHVDADGESGDPGEQPQQNQETAEEFGEGGEICTPCWKSEAGNELNMVVKPAKHLVVSVVEKNNAQGETHDEQGEGLQAIEVAQIIPPAEKEEIDYSSARVEGSWASKSLVPEDVHAAKKVDVVFRE